MDWGKMGDKQKSYITASRVCGGVCPGVFGLLLSQGFCCCCCGFCFFVFGCLVLCMCCGVWGWFCFLYCGLLLCFEHCEDHCMKQGG